MGGFAWVTLATNDSYSLGALVLAHSLKEVGTAHQTAVLITPGVTSAMRDKLTSVFNVVQEVNILDSRDEANLRLLKRPELGITFTKLHCWRLTQFEKCVFLDADTLVLQNSDELFEREELSAAPDVGWPDCFNSGVFVYRPSLDTYEKLIQFALERGSFDGGDQGLLNLFFADWAQKDISRHLPFIYNVCSTACYSYLPAFKQFGANAKIIHFIGAVKPWLQYFNTETKRVQPSGDASHLTEFLQRWWDIFCSFIHPVLSPAMQAQSRHGTYPSYFPPQYDPPPNPTASAIHYEDAWDPWDDYDTKLAQTSQCRPNVVQQNSSYTQHQPQIHQNVLLPQPYVAAYGDVNRVPTPPPSPPLVNHYHVRHPHFEPTYQHQEPQYYHQQPQYHQELQHHQQPQCHQEPQYHHEKPQYHHQESQIHHREPQYHDQESQYHPPERSCHQESEHHQPHHSEPFSHSCYEESQDNRHSCAEAPQTTPYFNQNSTSENNRNEHVEVSQSFPHNFKSPIVPILNSSSLIPNEGQTSTIVSNESALNDSLEPSTEENAGLAGAFSQLTLGVARTPQQDAFENVLRKQAWEVGNIDYLGKDSFANIWSKISQTLAAASSESQPTVPETAPTAPSAESQVAYAPAESQAQSDVAATPVAPVSEPVQAKPEEPVLACPRPAKETPVATPVDSPATETKTETPVAVTAVPSEPVSPEIALGAQSAATEAVIPTTPTAELPKPSEPVTTAVPVTSAPSTPVGEVPKPAESVAIPVAAPSTPTADVPKPTEPASVAAPSTPTAEVPKPAEAASAVAPSTPTADVPKPVEPASVAAPSTPTAEVPKPAEAASAVAPSTPTADVPKPTEPASAAALSTPTAEVPKPAEPASAAAPSTPIAEVLKPAEPVSTAAPSTPTAGVTKPAELVSTAAPSTPTADVPKPIKPAPVTAPSPPTPEIHKSAETVPAVAPSIPTTDVPKSAESVPAAAPLLPVAEITSTETSAASGVIKSTAEAAKSVGAPAPGSKPKAECPKPSPAPTPAVKAEEPTSPKTEVGGKALPPTAGAPPIAPVKTPREVLKTPESNVPATPPPSGEPSASAPKKAEKSKKSAPKPKK